jgi:drug/metabolite transporter (DMT)-like permease
MKENIGLMIFAIVASISFGTWPSLAGSAPNKVPTGFLTICLALALLLAGIFQYIYDYHTNKSLLPQIQNVIYSRSIYFIAGAMLINAIGNIGFVFVVSSGKTNYMAIVMAAVPVITLLYSLIIMKNPMTPKELLGIIFVVIGIIMIKK